MRPRTAVSHRVQQRADSLEPEVQEHSRRMMMKVVVETRLQEETPEAVVVLWTVRWQAAEPVECVR